MGKKVIEAGKTTAREVGLKAIDVGKDVVIAKARALIDGCAPKNQETLTNNPPVRSATPALTQKSKDALAALTNINNLLAGSGVGANAISIQDLVKGSGLRLA